MSTPAQIQCRPVALLWVRRPNRIPFFLSTAFASVSAFSGALLDVVVTASAPSPGTGTQSLSAAAGVLFDVVVTAALPNAGTGQQSLSAQPGELFDVIIPSPTFNPGTANQTITAAPGELFTVIVPFSARDDTATQNLSFASGSLF